MKSKYNIWISQAPARIAVLEQMLNSIQGVEVVIDYTAVALAFPSQEPHPNTFDYPIIKHEDLVPWAASRGWSVKPIKTHATKGMTPLTEIHFTRVMD